MKRVSFIFSCLLLATGYLLLATAPAHAILENTKGVITDSNIQSEPLTLGVSLGSVTSVRDLKDYIALGYRYAIGIVVICAIVMLVYGGFRYLIGSAMGDMSKAKKIIFDALMGLVIVLGAYTILQTINKATLSLKVPNLTSVGNRAACLGFSSCQFDKDCRSDDASQTSCGQNARCILIGKAGRGYCTAGGENQLCHDTGEVPSEIQEQCKNDDPAKQCNNNGARSVPCQTGLRCVIAMGREDSDLNSQYRFICRKVREIKNVENNQDDKAVIGHKCTKDGDCEDLGAPRAVCIRVSSGFGYCSDGSEGARCRCSTSDGCGASVFRGSTNNHGTGEIACASGLECTAYKIVEGTLAIDAQWYCQKNLAPAK